MTINEKLLADILRLYHVEKWRCGTIAHQLGIHHGTVERVLCQEGLVRHGKTRATRIDAYLPFILQTLEKYPKLNASRLYTMVRERGYHGGSDYFRHLIAQYRPRPQAEAYLRLVVLPGEQAQCDWGTFSPLQIGRVKHRLMAFVMVLSWSRRIFLRFYLNARMENFLRGHVAAFGSWNALPRVILYDNLKSAVLERQGDAIRFNPTLTAFASHYRFEIRPVAVARGNEKGRVERAIHFIRVSFFAARVFTDIDDLNQQAEEWCLGQADDRLCPQDKTKTVREAFAEEQPKLLCLPADHYQVDERVAVSVGKTPYVRFDLNDYSVPFKYVRRTLTVVADLKMVRILDGQIEVASHQRSFDRGVQVEDLAHIHELQKRKAQAHEQRGMSRLTQAVPSSVQLLSQAADRGDRMGTITAHLLRLLDRYGAFELERAICTALLRGVPHPNAVCLALEAQREERNQLPPVDSCLPQHVTDKDVVIKPHGLNTYDELTVKERNSDES